MRGKVVLITGGARGIGLALARTVAEKGARPVIADIDKEAATRAASTVGQDCHRIIEVNLKGTINGTLSAMTRMEQRGAGQIVNVSAGR